MCKAGDFLYWYHTVKEKAAKKKSNNSDLLKSSKANLKAPAYAHGLVERRCRKKIISCTIYACPVLKKLYCALDFYEKTKLVFCYRK